MFFFIQQYCLTFYENVECEMEDALLAPDVLRTETNVRKSVSLGSLFWLWGVRRLEIPEEKHQQNQKSH